MAGIFGPSCVVDEKLIPILARRVARNFGVPQTVFRLLEDDIAAAPFIEIAAQLYAFRLIAVIGE